MHVRTDRFALTARPPCRLIAVASEGGGHLAITLTVVTVLKRVRIAIHYRYTHTLGKKKLSNFCLLAEHLSCFAPEMFYHYRNIVLYINTISIWTNVFGIMFVLSFTIHGAVFSFDFIPFIRPCEMKFFSV